MKTLALCTHSGTPSREEYRKLPHALRAARELAVDWGRPIFVAGPTKVWAVRPDKAITVRERYP